VSARVIGAPGHVHQVLRLRAGDITVTPLRCARSDLGPRRPGRLSRRRRGVHDGVDAGQGGFEAVHAAGAADAHDFVPGPFQGGDGAGTDVPGCPGDGDSHGLARVRSGQAHRQTQVRVLVSAAA
jgi:hypothetical protein